MVPKQGNCTSYQNVQLSSTTSGSDLFFEIVKSIKAWHLHNYRLSIEVLVIGEGPAMGAFRISKDSIKRKQVWGKPEKAKHDRFRIGSDLKIQRKRSAWALCFALHLWFFFLMHLDMIKPSSKWVDDIFVINVIYLIICESIGLFVNDGHNWHLILNRIRFTYKKNWALHYYTLLVIINYYYYYYFLCFHMVFNNSLLFMLLSNLI
jgi:hypothetical protein